MKRRDVFKTFGITAFTFSIAGCTEHLFTTTKRTTKKPNIIYIIADDLGYGDLGCYGQKIIKTPNLDRMALEGMRFTQHYAGSTVCAPSRSVLMTGLHSGHTFVRGNTVGNGKDMGEYPIPADTYTLAKMLKTAGYKTGCFGKWGLGYPGSSGDPTHQGFDRFFGYNSQHKAHVYYTDYLWDNNDKVYLKENAKGGKKIYSHDLISHRALKFIEHNSDRPFFLYVPFTIPHAELHVPEDSMKPYLNLKEADPYGDISKPYESLGYNAQERPHAAFAGMVSRMDSDVGKIFALLKKLNIDNNTIVMFTSDNGPHQEGGADPAFFNSSGPLKGIKRDLYEGGIRVPMIARWPNKITSGTTTDHVSAFWDVMPTCADIAAINAPKEIDGISFLPTLLGKGRQKKHKFLYWEFHEAGGKQAVRIGDYKGIRLNVLEKPDGPIQLFDLNNDLGEQNNIADRHPQIVKKIKAIMKAEHTPSKVYPLESLDNLGSLNQKNRNGSKTHLPYCKAHLTYCKAP